MCVAIIAAAGLIKADSPAQRAARIFDHAKDKERAEARLRSHRPISHRPVIPREAIRDHFVQTMATALDAQVRLSDFGTSGDLAYVTVGISYQAETESRMKPVTRTDMFVLRRRSNQWQIEMHIAREER